MIFRALDANGDFTFGKGKGNYLVGQDAIGANIRTRLLSWVGDCFFDINAGIDWYNRLGSKGQRALLEADLKRVILQSFGVTGLTSFDTVLQGRAFSASYEVDTFFTKSFIDTVTLGADNA